MTAPAQDLASDALVNTFFNWDLIAETFPRLITEGLANTLIIAAGAIVLGVVIALVAAMLLLSNRRLVRLPARIYVDVFRGLPVIITVMLVGVGLPAAGVRPFGTDPFGYAILAIGIISGAYTAEIFRSGIQSVDAGQLQAARSLGLSYLKAMRLVVVPQGIRRVLPAMAGQFVKDIKESSLVYLLGLAVGQRELYFIAHEEVARTYNSSPLIAAGLCYLALTIPLTYFVNYLDRRLREGPRPGPLPAPAEPDLPKTPLQPAGTEAGERR
ncbi:amino acid ABC transporter permease [Streptomyces collinus]|jgi:polar amino acid transport system permease protein|uniref:amino acid ABC transporter permease n=1 Tax=Streptomyces collinus TaxID=42684 RepID=UPI00364A9C6A